MLYYYMLSNSSFVDDYLLHSVYVNKSPERHVFPGCSSSPMDEIKKPNKLCVLHCQYLHEYRYVMVYAYSMNE